MQGAAKVMRSSDAEVQGIGHTDAELRSARIAICGATRIPSVVYRNVSALLQNAGGKTTPWMALIIEDLTFPASQFRVWKLSDRLVSTVQT